MTLEEAIKYNQLISTNFKGSLGYEGVAALKLSIAAMTRIKYQRQKPTVPHKTLLPGETKD